MSDIKDNDLNNLINNALSKDDKLIVDKNETIGHRSPINSKRLAYLNVIVTNKANANLYNMDIDVLNVEEGSTVHIYGTVVNSLIGSGMVYRHTLRPIATSTINEKSKFSGSVEDIHCGL